MSRGRTLGQIADDGDLWSEVRWPCVWTPAPTKGTDALRPGAVRRASVLRSLVALGGGGEVQYRRTVLANGLRRAWGLGAEETR